jgi:hypothetical protein
LCKGDSGMIAKKAHGVRKARKSASPANVTARWDDLGGARASADSSCPPRLATTSPVGL